MPVEMVVFLSLENGTCAALSTCATPPRRQPIVARPCETSPSLAVARITLPHFRYAGPFNPQASGVPNPPIVVAFGLAPT
jgi:hypothetical protein